MKKIKLLVLSIALLLTPALALAGGKAYVSDKATMAVPIAGVDSSGNMVTLQLDGTTGATRVWGGSVTTTAQSGVSVSASSTTILNSNTSRTGVIIYNDATATLYLRLSATAATASIGGYTYNIPAGGTLTLPDVGQPIYTGQIVGIWSAATGNGAAVTEL